MQAQLKDTPRQWVSLNNTSKSKKQKSRVIQMTDNGIITTDDGVVTTDNKADADKKTQPVTPTAQ